jgi:predicted nucleotidyltransferase
MIPSKYQTVLSRFVSLCHTDERVVASFLGGSYARHQADDYSDLDLNIILFDQCYESFWSDVNVV